MIHSLIGYGITTTLALTATLAAQATSNGLLIIADDIGVIVLRGDPD